MSSTTAPGLSPQQQEERRDWFRRHYAANVPFNRTCGITVRTWTPELVEMVLPYADILSAHVGVLHGGVLSALVDTCGTAAVLAGHDFDRGSRISTAALSVQYLSVAKGEDVVAGARVVKRGRTLHVAAVEITGLTSGRLLVTGQVTASVEGERPGLLGPLPDDPAPGGTP